MRKGTSRSKGGSALRETAEKLLTEKPRKDSPGDVASLTHEFEVRQVELEMQTEELRRSQLETEASREKYVDFYDFAPVGYLTFNEKGMVSELNLTAAALLSVQRKSLANKPFSPFIQPESQDVFYRHRQEVLNSSTKQTCELVFKKSDGTLLHVQLDSIGVEINGKRAMRTVVTDITERKRAEELLQEYEKAVEGSVDMIATVDRDYRYRLANAAFLKYRDIRKEEVIGRSAEDILGRDVFEQVIKENLDKCFHGEVVHYEMKHTYPELGERELLVSYLPIRGSEGVDRVTTIIRDITERKRAEELLRESEESYRSLVETSPDAIFLHEEGKFIYLNPAAVRLYGAGSAEELYGKSAFDIVHPDDRAAIRNRTELIMATGAPAPLKEIRIVRRNGSAVDVEATAGVSYYRGKKVIQVIQRDITERKQAEEKIKASLREKGVLLQEIHHRVKNNLQIISSLLYLQATRTEHPRAVAALEESRDRVKSMALIHETLYQSPNLASIDVGKYVRSLVSDLRRSYVTEDSSVRLTVNVGDIPLGITEAIPCGLIINELVSNALKHAFPDGREGEITIQLQRAGANQIVLTVSDNGVGLPQQMDFRRSPSLGLTLINSLVEQLNGSIELDRSKGTAFTIRFG